MAQLTEPEQQIDFWLGEWDVSWGDDQRGTNRIDHLTTVTGVDFDACYETRVIICVDDVEVNFIDLDNLRKNKRAIGRPLDLADLDNLE